MELRGLLNIVHNILSSFDYCISWNTFSFATSHFAVQKPKEDKIPLNEKMTTSTTFNFLQNIMWKTSLFRKESIVGWAFFWYDILFSLMICTITNISWSCMEIRMSCKYLCMILRKLKNILWKRMCTKIWMLYHKGFQPIVCG